jgi:hypothetical protein
MVCLAALAAPVGWVATDRLEADNAFCVSCHLDAGTPLHRDNHTDFEERSEVSLAVAHSIAGNGAHEDGAFRCIDCHGGSGFVGRARVKLLSAKDAFWYVSGRFEEPDGMHWPLRDEDCAGCHVSYEERSSDPGHSGDPAFHELAVHNQKLGVDCVTCHLSHERGALASHYFVQPLHVRAQCAQCHPEFEEDSP